MLGYKRGNVLSRLIEYRIDFRSIPFELAPRNLTILLDATDRFMLIQLAFLRFPTTMTMQPRLHEG